MREQYSRESGAWAAPVLVTVITALFAIVLWSPSAIGVFVDDGIYVMLGKALASGEGLRYMGVAGAPPAPKYPPLYPLTLAVAWKVSSSFLDAIPYLKAVGVLCAVIAAGAFAWYVQHVLRLPRWFAIGVALLAWSTVDAWQYAVIPLSEPLFLLTLLVCLAAAAHSERNPNAWAATILFLLAFSAAYYTRTTGIVLAAAVLCSHLLARHWRAASVVAVGTVFVMLPWAVWTKWTASRIPPPLADLLGGYGGHLGSQISLDPAGFFQGVPGRAAAIGLRAVDIVMPALPSAIRPGVAPILLAVGIAGTILLWKRSPAWVLTVLAYAGVLCVWPFVARRLMYPLMPLLILMVGAGFYELRRRATNRWLRIIVEGMALLWLILLVQSSARTLYARGHDRIHLDRSVRLLWAVGAVQKNVPSNAVVVAPEFWAGLHLYTGRTVAPSGRFRPVAGSGTTLWGTPEEQLALWELVDAEYVLLEFGEAVHGPTLGLIQETCGPGAVQLVARYEAMHLVRLNMDDRCREAIARGFGAER